MSRQQIRELAQLGVEFGSHGRTHTDLTSMSNTKLEIELSVSRRELEDILGRPVTSISYPFGRLNSRVLAAAASAGYETGYTMQYPRSADSPLARGRVAVYSFDTLLTVKLKLSDSPAGRLEGTKASVVNRLSGGTIWLNRLRDKPDTARR
jgi:peptidoglycan/xylan/chitin deacetylase (PgdA/CDA1 family)